MFRRLIQPCRKSRHPSDGGPDGKPPGAGAFRTADRPQCWLTHDSFYLFRLNCFWRTFAQDLCHSGGNCLKLPEEKTRGAPPSTAAATAAKAGCSVGLRSNCLITGLVVPLLPLEALPMLPRWVSLTAVPPLNNGRDRLNPKKLHNHGQRGITLATGLAKPGLVFHA